MPRKNAVEGAAAITTRLQSAGSIDDVIKTAGAIFRDAGIESAALDARVLAERAFELSHEKILLNPEQKTSASDLIVFTGFCTRRSAGEPVARILGVKEFWSLEFVLNAATLVPRPETELVVETGLGILAAKGMAAPRILDLGTGSGCILISLLTELPGATGVGIDLSTGALDVASANAKRHGVDGRVQFIPGSWNRAEACPAPFDLIVTNPPYIPANDICALAPEVRDHDPALALSGGDDGLEAYRQIAKMSAVILPAGATMVAETGDGQAKGVIEIFEAAGLVRAAGWLRSDLAGRERVVVVEQS